MIRMAHQFSNPIKDEAVNSTEPICVEQTKETLRQKGIMEFFPKKNN